MSDVSAPHGIRWTRVSRGFYLLGFGTFLLLTTQDLLPPRFWIEIASYWPVLLVAIGVRLLFERSPFPGLVLLGPTLVLGTMMYVAMHAPAARDDAGGEWTALRVERPAGKSDPLQLDGRLAFATVDLASRKLPHGVVIDGRASATRGSRPVRLEEEGGGRVVLTNTRTDETSIFVLGRHGTRAELGVGAGEPAAFDFKAAFTDTRFDVPATLVQRVSFNGAFNALRVNLGAPADDTRLDFEGAFNDVALEVPPGTPVRVGSEGFLNRVSNDADERHDGRNGAPEYHVRLHGAFNHLSVTTR